METWNLSRPILYSARAMAMRGISCRILMVENDLYSRLVFVNNLVDKSFSYIIFVNNLVDIFFPNIILSTVSLTTI